MSDYLEVARRKLAEVRSRAADPTEDNSTANELNELHEISPDERETELTPLHKPFDCAECGTRLPPDRLYLCASCAEQRYADIVAGRRRS